MQKALVIGKVWPEPSSSAAGWRMIQILDLLQSAGFEVSFCSPAAQSPHSAPLEKKGIAIHQVEINDESFDEFIRKLTPALVIFDRFSTEEQFGWRVKAQCENAVRVLDTEDLHFLREAREKAVLSGKKYTEARLQSETCSRELASILRCDLSLIISRFEMDLLVNQLSVPSFLLCYLPFLADHIGPDKTALWPAFAERKDFICVGNFLHAPNVDALRYLKQSIWPLIRRKMPDARLLVYGAYAEHKNLQLHNEAEGFILKGRCENIDQELRKARLMLAPLRFGAGLKGKVFSAWLQGTPAVLSPLAAEGFFDEGAGQDCIAADAESFAAKALRLYEDEEAWHHAQESGRSVVNTEFQLSHFQPLFTRQVQQLRQHLQTHREKNFFAPILWQEAFLSKKYMSLWIQEKNKVPR